MIHGRSPTDDLNDFDVNTAVLVFSWMSHFKQQFILVETIWRIYDLPRINSSSLKQLFKVTEKLIKNQTELNGVTTIDDKEHTWRSTSLLCERAHQITNAKTCVFADSVLCLGSMSHQPVEAWKNKIKWCLENRYLKDLDRIDGERMEFEWTIFPGFTSLGILEVIQKMMTELQCEPEQFKGRIIFMSMFNDIVWRERGNTEKCIMNSVTVANYARQMPARTLVIFWDMDQRRNGTELALINPTGPGTKLPNEWCSTLQKAVIQNFVPPAPWKEES